VPVSRQPVNDHASNERASEHQTSERASTERASIRASVHAQFGWGGRAFEGELGARSGQLRDLFDDAVLQLERLLHHLRKLWPPTESEPETFGVTRSEPEIVRAAALAAVEAWRPSGRGSLGRSVLVLIVSVLSAIRSRRR
jgi:hypothetical protein